jgi:lipoate-protein ligase A
MKYLDLTLPTPGANLACDEALLDACDENPAAEILRFWEPTRPFVVLGYANHAAAEADLAACRAADVPVLRRCSGGGAVLQGPGCLNYSLVLGLDLHPDLHTIPAANGYIMEQQRRAMERLLESPVSVRGVTDLCCARGGETLKFSGNAQRRKRHALLFHGTFLLDFDLDLLPRFLPMPSREPDYRQRRSHRQFVTNVELAAGLIKTALRETWAAVEPVSSPPEISAALLEKYTGDEWNLKF